MEDGLRKYVFKKDQEKRIVFDAEWNGSPGPSKPAFLWPGSLAEAWLLLNTKHVSSQISPHCWWHADPKKQTKTFRRSKHNRPFKHIQTTHVHSNLPRMGPRLYGSPPANDNGTWVKDSHPPKVLKGWKPNKNSNNSTIWFKCWKKPDNLQYQYTLRNIKEYHSSRVIQKKNTLIYTTTFEFHLFPHK